MGYKPPPAKACLHRGELKPRCRVIRCARSSTSFARCRRSSQDFSRWLSSFNACSEMTLLSIANSFNAGHLSIHFAPRPHDPSLSPGPPLLTDAMRPLSFYDKYNHELNVSLWPSSSYIRSGR